MAGKWLPLAVVVLTLCVFLPALQNDFVYWDDTYNLLDNPHYRGLGWAELRWMLTATTLGHWMPLTWVSYGLDYTLWGMRPMGYHLTSVLLHAANVGLVLMIGRHLGLGPWGSAAAALLWGLHPLRVESVAWATERRDVLYAACYLTTILLYLRGRVRWALVTFIAACLSKSLAVSLPVVLLLLDWYRGHLTWAGVRATWAFAVVALLTAVNAVGVLPHAVMLSLTQLSLLERLSVTVYGLGFYAAKTLVPLNLSPLYELPRDLAPLVPWIAAGGLFVLAMSWTAWHQRRRRPAILAAWVCSLVMLGPVIGLLQNGPQIAADRYTYLASVGWMLLAGRWVESL